MHFLHRVQHVFVRLFQGVELLLLRRREQWPDLRARGFHDRADFLHRFLVDRHDLWLGLIDDRRDFRLLFRRQVQFLGEMFERIAVVHHHHSTVTRTARTLGVKSDAAEGEARGYGECDKCSFHILFCLRGAS